MPCVIALGGIHIRARQSNLAVILIRPVAQYFIRHLNRHPHFGHVMYPHQVHTRENARGYRRRGGEARLLVGLLGEK